jgi:hypothetical protein
MSDPEQERLDELEAEIQHVKHDAEEHGTLPPEHHKPTFADPDGDGEDG